MSRKVTRKLTGPVSVSQLNVYLTAHFIENDFPIKITIERWTNRRSLSQNALLHAWIADIAGEIGDDPRSVKDDLKFMFAPVVVGPLGKERPMNTSEMTVPQMTDFMTAIQVKGAEMGWPLREAA